MKTMILSLALLSGTAMAQTAPKPVAWFDALSDEEKSMCQTEGGCRVVTTAWLNSQVMAQAEALAQRALVEISDKMCQRKSI